MLTKIIFAIKSINAYWRSVPFSEIAELYASRFFRIVAQNLVDVFVIIILYKSGYSLVEICLLLTFYYGIRVPLSFFGAYLIAWLGPKKSILLSNLLAIPALAALSFINSEATGFLVIFYYVFQAISIVILSIATDVQFSSISSSSRAGSQLGLLYIIEKIAAALAPAIGGLLAFWLGPSMLVITASALMLAGAAPLFFSPEQLRRKQKVTYRGFPWKFVSLQMLSPLVRGGSFVATNALWAIFIALAVFDVSSNAIYAQLGAFTSISFTASIIVSKVYGILIDKKKSLQLLWVGVAVDSLAYLSRPFVSSPLSLGLVNVVNETGYSAYAMPTVRGQYDMVDRLPGYRVVYFSLTMLFYSLGASVFSLIAAGLALWLGELQSLKIAFFAMAALIPLVALHGFPSLRLKR